MKQERVSLTDIVEEARRQGEEVASYFDRRIGKRLRALDLHDADLQDPFPNEEITERIDVSGFLRRG